MRSHHGLRERKREKERERKRGREIIFRKSNQIPNHTMQKLKHEMKNISSCSFKKSYAQTVGEYMYA